MQEFYFAMDKRADEEESPAHAWLKFGAAHMNESRKNLLADKTRIELFGDNDNKCVWESKCEAVKP